MMTTKTNSIPSFIVKLVQLLEDPHTNDSIAWNETGTSFEIIDPLSFAESILPKLFKHKNFSSFVRQLNMYGFYKLEDDSSKTIYWHPCFKRGEQILLKSIKRKKRSQKEGSRGSVHADKSIGQEATKKSSQKSLNKQLLRELEELYNRVRKHNQSIQQENVTIQGELNKLQEIKMSPILNDYRNRQRVFPIQADSTSEGVNSNYIKVNRSSCSEKGVSVGSSKHCFDEEEVQSEDLGSGSKAADQVFQTSDLKELISDYESLNNKSKSRVLDTRGTHKAQQQEGCQNARRQRKENHITPVAIDDSQLYRRKQREDVMSIVDRLSSENGPFSMVAERFMSAEEGINLDDMWKMN